MKDVIKQNQTWIDETWAKVEKKLAHTAVKSRNKIPYTTVDGVHNDRAAEGAFLAWTNGFWGGTMWLMYLATGNEEFRKTAERQEELLDAGFQNYAGMHHDVGFMWHLTSGANYRITGNKASAARNYYAASTLFSRYNVEGDFIQAWNGAGKEGYSIIDCLMNLSILYWASEEIGNDRFKKIAVRHMEMSLRDHIRPDGSVNHIVDHEMDKPGVKQVLGGQGYSAESCWSRGLAWAVYGCMISYIHVGKPEYLEAAKKTADFFIEHCKTTGYVPAIDFTGPQVPVYYDSTAGVCAACGMLEIAKHVTGEESAYYTQEAINILKAIEEKCCDYTEEQDALVLLGSERYPLEPGKMSAVHKPIIYGDFFFVEALFKLKGNEFFIW